MFSESLFGIVSVAYNLQVVVFEPSQVGDIYTGILSIFHYDIHVYNLDIRMLNIIKKLAGQIV